jgi:hypothetical protein
MARGESEKTEKITINLGLVDLGQIGVLGLASIADDVSVQLALATIASVEVLGAFRAPTAVKAALAPRTA